MPKITQEGKFNKFDGSKMKVGIVVAQFNKNVSDKLLDSALMMCEAYNINKKNIVIHEVPGSVEIPLILNAMAKNKAGKKFDMLVALGAVIEGETKHFDYVCKIASEGILRVMLDNNIPIGFGILTCKNHAQAMERANAGGRAVEAGIQSAQIIKKYGKGK